MPKPNKGKTKTIKKRAIYVYLPSQAMAENWKNKADQAGTSISKFVIDKVEDSLRQEQGEEGYLNRLDLINKLSKQEEELKKLRKDNRLQEKLIDNLDNEAKLFRAKPFLDDSFQGIRRYDKEMINVLKEGGSITAEELLIKLNVDSSQTEIIKSLNKQLEMLENYGLVEYVGRGWKWKQ